jgi:uncharacterized protein YhaN
VKFLYAHIFGYGRFIGREFTFAPGLQVFLGPNEQGKSTLRSFLTDMLYGQKRRSSVSRQYEDHHAIRIPWQNPDCYGGLLRYALDNGTQIEVVRNFSKNREQVQIYDITLNREITSEFPVLRNREVDFAVKHLGVPKEVFTSTATITHLSLDGLGDKDATEKVREHVLRLADSFDEAHTAETALGLLQQRLEALGTTRSRTKPLPLAQARVEALRQELAERERFEREWQERHEQRRRLIEDRQSLEAEYQQTQQSLEQIRRYELLRRAVQRRELLAEKEKVETEMMAYSDVRAFPREQNAHVQRLSIEINHGEEELARLSASLKQLQEESAREEAALRITPEESAKFSTYRAQWEECQREYKDAERTWQEYQRRRDEVQEREKRLETKLQQYPPFHLAADTPDIPAYVHGRITIFTNAEEELKGLEERLRLEQEKIQQKETYLQPLRELFAAEENLIEKIREHEVLSLRAKERTRELDEQIFRLEQKRNEPRVPVNSFAILALLCGVVILGIIAVMVISKNYALFMALVPFLVILGYFGANIIMGLRWQQDLEQEIQRLQEERKHVAEMPEELRAIERLFIRSGCGTARELEAQYLEYRLEEKELEAFREKMRVFEAEVKEMRRYVEDQFQATRLALAKMGETIDSSEQLAEAGKRIQQKFQSYLSDSWERDKVRDELRMLQAEITRCEERLRETRNRVAEAEQRLRTYFEQLGWNDAEQPRNFEQTLAAFHEWLRGQEALLVHLKEKRLQANGLEKQILERRSELEKKRHERQMVFTSCKVNSLEEWNAKYTRAEHFQRLKNQWENIDNQLERLGADANLGLDPTDEEIPAPPASLPSYDALVKRARQQEQEIHAIGEQLRALDTALAQAEARHRPRYEIEEELAEAEQRLALLSEEHEATLYAIQQLEAISQDRHARVAPILSKHASDYFARMTEYAYSEVRLDPEFQLHVRIPQKGTLHADPEKVLSKGTVDQLYLALRLAFVTMLSRNAETLPLLLDDPFANYDDRRLAHAFDVLKDMAQRHQILLFTCREDVAETAQAREIPVYVLTDEADARHPR